MNVEDLAKFVYQIYPNSKLVSKNFKCDEEKTSEILEEGVRVNIFRITKEHPNKEIREYGLGEELDKDNAELFQKYIDEKILEKNIFNRDFECLSCGTILHIPQDGFTLPKKCSCGNKKGFKFLAKNVEELLLYEIVAHGFRASEFGDYIMKKYNFKVLEENEKVYIYRDGYYQENGNAKIKEYATKLLDSFYKKNYVEEILSYIKNLNHVRAKDIDTDWINFENGLFNPLTRKFKEHTPDIFCVHQLPYDYNPEAKCPVWLEKLKEKCDEDWKFDTIQEWFGYHFIKQKYKKAFLFHGPSNTMKGTVLYVLNEMLGSENTTAMTLQHLTTDYINAPAYLYGKLGNICADLPKQALRNIGWFLSWTDRDKQTARELFKGYTHFYPDTKLTFSCNDIPSTPGKGDEFYIRWIIMKFEVPHTKIDPDLKEKLSEELSGIFNWALEGLDRLLENNKFSYPLSTDETKDLYERGSNSISSFIFRHINTEEADGDEGIEKRIVYKNYKKYCEKTKLNVENNIKFGREFFTETGCGQKRIKTIPAYSGIKFKNMEDLI